MQGKLIVIDGLDGSGSGEVITGLTEWAEDYKLSTFDLIPYQKEKKKLPPLDFLLDSEVIISAEPTFSGIGRVIREELITNKEYHYSPLTIAQAYSLDREVLFRSLLGPFLAKKEGYIFQQRSVSSSMAYQPVDARMRGKQLSLSDVIDLPGNKFILENYPPDLLILTKCDAETALTRIKERKKQDNCFFEELNFQKELQEVYESTSFKRLFENRGSKVVYIDTNSPSTKEDTRKKAKEILEDFFSSLSSYPKKFINF